MILTARKKPKLEKYDITLIKISPDEKDENAQRLINAYSNALTGKNSIIGLFKYFIRPFIQDEERQEEIINKYSLGLIIGKARAYRYFISESEDLLKNQNFLSWSKVCLSNLAKDYLRTKTRNKIKTFTEVIEAGNEESESLEMYISSESIDPLEEVAIREEIVIKKDFMDKALEDLEIKDSMKKEILNLYYFNDFSYKEIAKELKIPIGTVKSRLHQAKKALSKLEQISVLLN
jgi:RNA polymerase sigma factor (sigma-70 family)